MRKETWCEPVYRNGYWSIEIIEEFVPNWLQRAVLRKQPWSRTHQYTNIDEFGDIRPSSYGWRHQPSGDDVGGPFCFLNFRLSDHVDRHLDRMRLEQLQEKEIARGKP